MRAKILGLESGKKPSKQDIDSSSIFTLRREADELGIPTIIGHHWMDYLKEKGHLADCLTKDFTFQEEWLPCTPGLAYSST